MFVCVILHLFVMTQQLIISPAGENSFLNCRKNTSSLIFVSSALLAVRPVINKLHSTPLGSSGEIKSEPLNKHK